MTNKNQTFFNVDARILFQLGEQLVTDRAVALAELIKNSYDADASYVKVSMREISSKGGNILIKDNGEGMTAKSFEDNWMRIATIDKELNPISNIYGRKRAGEKGIGRFACRRLSEKMLLKSVAINSEGEKEQLNATFDWENFMPGKDLISIPINYSVEKVDDTTPVGTSLYLKDLHDSWNKSDIRRLRLELLDLFIPDTLIRSKKRSKEEDDPGFNVEFDIPEFSEITEALDRSFYKNAWAELTGEIDSEGNIEYNINYLDVITKKKEKVVIIGESKCEYIKDVELKCYVFIYRSDLFGSSEFGTKRASEIGRERAGVKLYSDIFRVFGYGRPGDDWLRVDYDRARSIELLDPKAMELLNEVADRPGLRIFQNRSLFGHVRYNKDENPLLEITVNRDSLIENEAFEELRHFTRLGIDYATVLYSNLVFKEREKIKEQQRIIEEQEKRKIEEHKERLEKEKKAAEELAKKAEERRKNALERAKKAELEKRLAEKARIKAEEERRKAESARRLAEAERRKAEANSSAEIIDKKRKLEEETEKFEEEKRHLEQVALRKEEEARQKVEEEQRRLFEEQRRKEEYEQKAKQEKERIDEEEKKRQEEGLKKERETLESEKSLLRVLASTGTMMLMFQHELQGLTEDMSIIILNFRRTIAGKGDKFLESLIDNYEAQVDTIKELGKLMGSIIDHESRTEKKDWVLLPVVNTIIKPFEKYIKEVGALLQPNIPENLRTPRMLRSELISIIHNLITNSIKAIRTTNDKRIMIDAIREKNELIISVFDSGKGLPKDKWIKVFEPFTGYSEPDLRFGTGTGLGLKIVKDIVNSNGGEVMFSEPPSNWTTCIKVILPFD